MTEEQIIEHARTINEKVMSEYLNETKDEMTEEQIIEHAKFINEKVMNEYLNEIKNINEK